MPVRKAIGTAHSVNVHDNTCSNLLGRIPQSAHAPLSFHFPTPAARPTRGVRSYHWAGLV